MGGCSIQNAIQYLTKRFTELSKVFLIPFANYKFIILNMFITDLGFLMTKLICLNSLNIRNEISRTTEQMRLLFHTTIMNKLNISDKL